MAVVFHHRPDRGVVDFSGELDFESGAEIVRCIEVLVEDYHYDLVQIDVASPGGMVPAFDHVRLTLERFQAQGVRFVTRVVSSAASAAAVLVSLGDVRVAEPGARLLFHCARGLNEVPSTAEATAALHATLLRADDGLMTCLVERAMRCAPGFVPAPARAEPSDLKVLEILAGKPRGGGQRDLERRARKLVRRVARRVEEAVRSQDRDALERLYRSLSACEASISAKLARTLRLVDHVGLREPRAAQASGPPGLAVPEWRSLYPPLGAIPRPILARHTLALGETGSGKTASVILPVVAAMVRAPREQVGGGLVIDPKGEIGPVLQALAPGRVRRLDASGLALDLMAGPCWSLDGDLAAGRWLSAAVRILLRVASFVPSSPVRVLGAHPVGDSNNEFFDREGTALLLTVLAVVLMVIHPDTPVPAGGPFDVSGAEADPEALRWVKELRARSKPREGRGPNALTLAAWVLDSPALQSAGSDGTVSLGPDSSASQEWLFARVARLARAAWTDGPGEGRDALDRVLGYWTPMARIDRQYAGVLATARNACSELAGPASTTLYFGCEPGYAGCGPGRKPDFSRLVARDADGTLALFQPPRGGTGSLVAMALKALFFEAVLDDPDRAAGSPDVPLVAYVADEFHRFVTSDLVHGEQSFLDTCRSFGAFCILATQSVSSVEHALAQGGGSARQDEAAVSILWNNCASKLVFRTTDLRTADRVQDLCPYRPGQAGVTRVRPISTLAPGECYALLADGRFERRRLEPFVPPALEAGWAEGRPAPDTGGSW